MRDPAHKKVLTPVSAPVFKTPQQLGQEMINEAACRKADIARIAKLLDQGAPIDARDLINGTALMAAAQLDNIELAGFLLDRGADVNLKDNYGMTALDWVKRHRKQPEIQALLEAAWDKPALPAPAKPVPVATLHEGAPRQPAALPANHPVRRQKPHFVP